MSNFLLITLIFLGTTSLRCQPKEVPPEHINAYRVDKFLVKQDSVIKIYDHPLMHIRRFYVKINNAIFDTKSNELRLIGTVCYLNDTVSCLGIPGVSIFGAIKNNDNILSSIVEITQSSSNQDTLEKDGLFDFRFKIEKGRSLFFFMPDFYLEEFKLGELFKNRS